MVSRYDFESLLRPLLTPRVPDTAGNAAARDYISSLLAELGWDVALDTFTQDTAVGEVTFSNIVATRNAASPRRLVLAAHYDSKMTPEGFIGATDSAVPCAMLLHLARTMDSLLPAPDTDPELTLQLIFFDGLTFRLYILYCSVLSSVFLFSLVEATPNQLEKLEAAKAA